MKLEEKTRRNLKKVKDPELGLNVVDMGFIYEIKIKDGKAKITMSLTSPGCPMKNKISSDVKEAAEKTKGVNEAEVEVVWKPEWTPEKMTERARQKLGW